MIGRCPYSETGSFICHMPHDLGPMWEVAIQIAWIVVMHLQHSQIYSMRAGQRL